MKGKGSSKTCLEPIATILIVIFGFGILSVRKWIVDVLIEEVFVIKPDNYFFHQWKDPTNPSPNEVYFFNWTNPQDLMNTSVKPIFQEIGPLVLSKVNHRSNITFNDNNTITFRNKNTYFVNEEASQVNLKDNITSLNIVLVYASDQSKTWNFLFRKGFAVAVHDTPFHITKTVSEWLFDGYEDALLSSASYLPFYSDLPDKVAWFYQRNGSETYDGVMNMGTGLGNSTLGKIYRWNYRKRTDYRGQCGDVEALSEIYPPYLKKDKVEIFIPDFCRTVVFDYNETVYYKGLEAYRFVGGLNFIDNGKIKKENKCYCKGKCLKFGVVDFSKCKYGMPAYLSLPHFNLADPKYIDDVVGMKPRRDDIKHNLELLIFPTTGNLLKMTISVQVNMYLEPNPTVSKFEKLPELMMPLVWIFADYELDTLNLIALNLLFRLSVILEYFSYLLIFSGIALYIRFLYHSLSCKEIEMNGVENLNLISHNNCCDVSKKK